MNKEARDLFCKGDYKKVVEILTPLERAGVAAEIDIERLVAALYKLGDLKEAEAIVRSHPENRQLDHVHYRILEAAEREEEAAYVRREALVKAQEKLTHAQSGWDKSRCYNDVGVLLDDFNERAEYFEKSVEEAPQNRVAHFNWALVLRKQKQFDEALEHARISVELKPEFASAVILVRELEEAQEIDTRPTTAASETSKRSLCDRKNLSEDKVSSEIERVVSQSETKNATLKTDDSKSNPDNLTASKRDWTHVVVDLLYKNQYSDAVGILCPLEKAGILTDDQVERLVNSLYKLGELREAEALVLRHPDNRLLDQLHVLVLKNTGRVEEAESVRLKALDYAQERLKHAQPGKEKARWLNQVAVLEADLKRVIEYYKKALEEDPTSSVGNFYLASCLKLDEQIDDALNHARISVDLRPDYADAIRLVKQLEDAQRDRESQELDPEFGFERCRQKLELENAVLKTKEGFLKSRFDKLTAIHENNLQAISELETKVRERKVEVEEKIRTVDQLLLAKTKSDEAHQKRIDSLEACNAELYKEVEYLRSQEVCADEGTSLYSKVKTWIDRSLSAHH